METNKPNLLWIASYYGNLLQRYARLLIHDAEIAAIIVKEVMEEQFDLNGLAPSKQLRQVLKTDVLNRCYYWKQSQIGNRPQAKVRELNEPGPAA
jgi:hypothetical protein